MYRWLIGNPPGRSSVRIYMAKWTKRGRVLGLVALVASMAGLGSGLALSLSGSKVGPETGTLSLQYGGFRVIEVSEGQGTVVVEEGDSTIATQSVARGRRFRFVLTKGRYRIHAELSSVQGESFCNTVRVLVRARSSNVVTVRCFNAAG
jgi:hypothetical protein